MDQYPEVPLTELRKNLGKCVRQAAHGRPVIVTHEGFPQAAIVSIEDFRRLAALKAESA